MGDVGLYLFLEEGYRKRQADGITIVWNKLRSICSDIVMQWIEMKERFTDKEALVSRLHALFFDVPLYEEIEYCDQYKYILNHPFLEECRMRCFCPFCKDVSIFTYNSSSSLVYSEDASSSSYRIIFECASREQHPLSIFFSRIHEKEGKETFSKIGQEPSLADLQYPLTQKYRSILKKDYKEFSKAIGLNAHGIGIGSFVYLRRIIERLLEEAHCEAKEQKDWDEDNYQKGRVLDKVGLLRGYLPRIFLDNKESYSVLSKGIHELDEDECLKFFPALKDMIELILDERLAEKNRLQKEQNVRKAIQEVHEKVRLK
jgi:hypothetical protein